MQQQHLPAPKVNHDLEPGPYYRTLVYPLTYVYSKNDVTKLKSKTTRHERVASLQSHANFVAFFIGLSLIIMVYTQPVNLQEFVQY